MRIAGIILVRVQTRIQQVSYHLFGVSLSPCRLAVYRLASRYTDRVAKRRPTGASAHLDFSASY